ncbi:MAG TPA: hypothetical protein VK179_10750 [Bacteroidales bacterium]|nr:hypothetical protein [Bacteroidales bacterium]
MSSTKTLYSNLERIYNANFRKYDLQNPFFCLKNNELTWHSYVPKESFYTYDEYFKWVINNNQYSLAVSGKALIQVYFREENRIITKGTLAFLPEPDSFMTYFRFDMDTINPAPYYHNTYHIHFGYRSDDIRFSLYKFPYPSEFIKFTLFLLGNSEFTSHNNERFFSDLATIGESFSHKFEFVTN